MAWSEGDYVAGTAIINLLRMDNNDSILETATAYLESEITERIVSNLHIDLENELVEKSTGLPSSYLD